MVLSDVGFEKTPVPPDHVALLAPPPIEPFKVTGFPEHTTWSGPASTVAMGLIVTVLVANVKAQPPEAAISFLTV